MDGKWDQGDRFVAALTFLRMRVEGRPLDSRLRGNDGVDRDHSRMDPRNDGVDRDHSRMDPRNDGVDRDHGRTDPHNDGGRRFTILRWGNPYPIIGCLQFRIGVGDYGLRTSLCR